MKRQPLIFALALLLIVSAALWGVNYRLDHPPLTQADKEFRALVAGFNSVEIGAPQDSITPPPLRGVASLNSTQTRAFVERIRFVDDPVKPVPRGNLTMLRLTFSRHDGLESQHYLFQSPSGSFLVEEVELLKNPVKGHQLNPRSNKRLNGVLDAYLPQRVRP